MASMTMIRLPLLAWPMIAWAILAQPACKEEEGGAPALPDAASEVPDAADAAEGSAPEDGGADAWVDPTHNADSVDLDPADGDPSLDIASSQIYFEGGAPWVRVAFFGPWPPSQQLYAWSCAVLLGTENAPVATYTVQGSAGTQSGFADGIDDAKVTFAVEAKGFRVRFGETTLAFDRYGIECSVQKTAAGAMVQDTSGNFVVGAKTDRPFGG
jgi:hypothetical protein